MHIFNFYLNFPRFLFPRALDRKADKPFGQFGFRIL